MSSFRKILMRLTLLAGLVAVAAVGGAAQVAAPRNLVALHANPGSLTNKQCLACHASIATKVTLNRNIKTFHRLHLESKLGTLKDCVDCHQSIDLRNGSAAALRKQVDPQLCAGCHSGGLDGAKVLFGKGGSR